MQVNYLGTHLTGEAQEWFYRNVERFDHQVHEWTLETVVQGLHTLTHHHASNKFDMVLQGNKTVQEVLTKEICHADDTPTRRIYVSQTVHIRIA